MGRFKNPSPLDLLDRTAGGESWTGFVGCNTALLLALGVLHLAPLHMHLVQLLRVLESPFLDAVL